MDKKSSTSLPIEGANIAKSTSIEEMFSALQIIVASMEKGDLPLDSALKMFEEGIILTQECQKFLENAEQRITHVLNHQSDKKEPSAPKKALKKPKQVDLDQADLKF
ncbi:hypothetical protein AwWohl_09740 [Gammaproteobacteria bacterium]|nr:hypothetical protein AwWohl_09740 [Gammaproteobacteria bacterium]